MAVDWGGGLPMDILLRILECLPVFYHRCFADVCVSWRSAAKERPSLPWVVYQAAMRKEEAMCDFLGAFGRDVRLSCRARHVSSELLFYFYGCSLDGHWVVEIHHHGVATSNPVTGAAIHFPPWRHPDADCCRICVSTPSIGASQGDGVFLAVAIVHFSDEDQNCNLQFARAGDDEWTVLETSLYAFFYLITFHDGKIYALRPNDVLLVYDISGPSPVVTQMRRFRPRGVMVGEYPHLVHSSLGELLLVSGSYRRDNSHNTWSFGVARLEDKGAKARWVEAKSLGKDAILFDKKHAICISTEAMPELRRSCIYFPTTIVNYQDVHLGIFNLENGRLEYQQLSRPPRIIYGPGIFWLIPSLD